MLPISGSMPPPVRNMTPDTTKRAPAVFVPKVLELRKNLLQKPTPHDGPGLTHIKYGQAFLFLGIRKYRAAVAKTDSYPRGCN
jgi:hypothetical protein